MTFEVTSVEDKAIQDVGFTAQFQQMAPVSVSHVNVTKSAEATTSTEAPSDASGEEPTVHLDDDLAELEYMMHQLAALEHEISSKVRYLSDVYHFKGPSKSLSFAKCDSLKCIMGMMYSRAKHIPSRLYSPWPKHQRPFGDEHERRPWFPAYHGGSDEHGNRLHATPPLCHCPPQRHGLPERIESLNDKTMSPAKLNGGKPDRPMSIVDTDAGSADSSSQVLTHHGRPLHNPDHRTYKWTPPPRQFGHRHPSRTTSIVLLVGGIVALLGLVIIAVHTRCLTRVRQSRRAGCCGRRRVEEEHDQHRGDPWISYSAITTRYSEAAGWLKAHVRRQETEDAEKETMMGQIGSNSGEEDDDISTTMEQEIAQFRAVANVVESLVTAEEGQSRGYARETQRDNFTASPSPTPTLPEYSSIDEELPAYDEGANDSCFVIDGFRYSPGSSCYTPNESSTTESSFDR
ncbi:hypothetical protein GGR52DRAFT_539657 [Hypoxylon sp. FL1284]|nr:hypothetical protein GGR52DRAFT_539657 [Hypoxylon sp. FL1284]